MIAALLLSLIPILIVTFLIRRMSKSNSSHQTISPLRSFFQYVILFAMMFVVSSGLIGLLGRLLNPPPFVAQDDSALALSLAFVVVGVPVLIGVGLWTRSSFRRNPQISREPLLAFFITLASIISLLSTFSSSVEAAQGYLSGDDFAGQSLASAIIWGLIWAGLWRLQCAIIPAANLRAHLFVGSVIGFLASFIGLVRVISNSLSYLVGVDEATFVSIGTQGITDAVVVTAISCLVWFHYWIKNMSKSTPDTLWFFYVLIVGVGGGLVVSVIATSTALYKAAVWLIGEPQSANALVHFGSTPGSVSAASVGLLAWWYHKSVSPESSVRNEINRIYDYLISGIGLISGAVGLSMILIATIEASITAGVIVGGSAINTLLAAGTLVIVGGPIWIICWRSIQMEVTSRPEKELSSPTRRIYLLILFGIGGVAAIISLVTATYQLFNDAFTVGIGSETIRDMRFAIGVLVSTAIISAYHWLIYRLENSNEVVFGSRALTVLLIGPANQELVRSIRKETKAKVSTLISKENDELIWPIERVVSMVKDTNHDQVVIVLDNSGLNMIPVKRN